MRFPPTDIYQFMLEQNRTRVEKHTTKHKYQIYWRLFQNCHSVKLALFGCLCVVHDVVTVSVIDFGYMQNHQLSF